MNNIRSLFHNASNSIIIDVETENVVDLKDERMSRARLFETKNLWGSQEQDQQKPTKETLLRVVLIIVHPYLVLKPGIFIFRRAQPTNMTDSQFLNTHFHK